MGTRRRENVLRMMPLVLAVWLGASTAPIAAAAPAEGTALESTEISATAVGFSLPLGSTVGSVCDPDGWAAAGARPCRLIIGGTFTGTMDLALADGTSETRSVRGAYGGWLNITATPHFDGCLETGGLVTYAVFDERGRRLGSVVSPLDQGDDEVCQSLPGSTDRNYFLRGDPLFGSGIFANLDAGNTLLVGTGIHVRRGVYRDTFNFDADIWGFR